MESVGQAIRAMLAEVDDKTGDDLRAARRRKYLDLGAKGLAA